MYPQTTKKFRGEDTGTFISEGNTYDRCSILSCFVVLFVPFQLFLVRAFVSLRKTIRIELVFISLVVDSCCIHLSFWCLYFTHSTQNQQHNTICRAIHTKRMVNVSEVHHRRQPNRRRRSQRFLNLYHQPPRWLFQLLCQPLSIFTIYSLPPT